MTLLLAGIIGASGGGALWPALRSALQRPAFERTNYRNARVVTGAGITIVVVLVGVLSLAMLGSAAGLDLSAAIRDGLTLATLLATGMALLGLVDDFGGVGESGGFRGHLRALAHGQLTTGALKLFGGAALGIAVAGAREASGAGWLLVDGAVIALSANLANLLDRAPGRTTKTALGSFVPIAVLGRSADDLIGVAVVLGVAAALLLPELREEAMLGDAGSNAIGAVVGLAVVIVGSPVFRAGTGVVLLALNLASERVSFSRVIERTPPLRFLDRLGRVRDPSA